MMEDAKGPNKFFEDFDECMSDDLKKLVHQTAAYDEFLSERERISDLVMEHVKNGGTLSDEVVLKHMQSISASEVNLRGMIGLCKLKLLMEDA